jgi:putative chitinase
MPIHFTDLATLYPLTPKGVLQDTVDPLNAACARYDITTGSRIAAFVSQTGHESMGFTRIQENLSYSAEGLMKVFPKYFPTIDLANAYAHNGQKIASRVYGNRMGNGPEATGDGWRYRGRGFIQVTGKSNYVAFAQFMGMRIEDVSVYLETHAGAAMSAGWFWSINSLNSFADLGKFSAITQRINGGQNGAQDRQAHYEVAKRLFDETVIPVENTVFVN